MAEHRTTGRILDILEVILEFPEGLTFTEICSKLDMPKSSLHPLLTTLSNRDYIYCSPKNNKYYIGHQLSLIGQGYKINLMENIQHEMDQLSKNLGETTFLGILSGGSVIYLLKAEFVNSVIYSVTKLGHKLPAYATGFGKALLSKYTKSEIEQIYPNGLEPRTENTISSIDELMKQMEIIKETGFSLEKEESTLEIQCVAMAIRYRDEYLAGISVVVPVYRYSTEKEKIIKTELLKAKMNIEALIENDRLSWVYNI